VCSNRSHMNTRPDPNHARSSITTYRSFRQQSPWAGWHSGSEPVFLSNTQRRVSQVRPLFGATSFIYLQISYYVTYALLNNNSNVQKHFGTDRHMFAIFHRQQMKRKQEKIKIRNLYFCMKSLCMEYNLKWIIRSVRMKKIQIAIIVKSIRKIEQSCTEKVSGSV